MSELKKVLRDENGLIQGVDYKFTSEGLIDWRKMLKPEHLAPKDRNFTGDISTLEDKDLMILLSGIKYLARLRGYNEIKTVTPFASPDYVLTVCSIEWIPNFETEGKIRINSDQADAHLGNTEGINSKFLGTCAINRAFGRVVRNSLEIKVIAEDEKQEDPQEEKIKRKEKSREPNGALVTLEKKMKKKEVTFEQVKTYLIESYKEDEKQLAKIQEFECIDDIPANIAYKVVGWLEKKETSK